MCVLLLAVAVEVHSVCVCSVVSCGSGGALSVCVLCCQWRCTQCVCSVVSCGSGGALSVCVLLSAAAVEVHSVCVFCC